MIKRWIKTDSGIYVPSGIIHESQKGNKVNFIAVKKMAESIEEMYLVNSIEIPNNSDLFKLIENAKQISHDRESNNIDNITPDKIYENVNFLRIAEAILSLKDNINCKEHLKKLIDGNLDLKNHEQSPAKDKLFELQVYNRIKIRNYKVQLIEPDIVIFDNGVETGLACKNVYSEKNIGKVLSGAVHQIEDSTKYGMVTLNIENLLPEGKNLVVHNNMDGANDRLQKHLNNFLADHKRHFKKYLSSDRIAGVIVSTICNVKFVNGKTKHSTFWYNTQYIIWIYPECNIGNEKRIKTLQRIF